MNQDFWNIDNSVIHLMAKGDEETYQKIINKVEINSTKIYYVIFLSLAPISFKINELVTLYYAKTNSKYDVTIRYITQQMYITLTEIPLGWRTIVLIESDDKIQPLEFAPTSFRFTLDFMDFYNNVFLTKKGFKF